MALGRIYWPSSDSVSIRAQTSDPDLLRVPKDMVQVPWMAGMRNTSISVAVKGRKALLALAIWAQTP